MSFIPPNQGESVQFHRTGETPSFLFKSSTINPNVHLWALADLHTSRIGFCLPLYLLYPAQGSKCSLNKLINNINQLDHPNGSPCSQRSASLVFLGVKSDIDLSQLNLNLCSAIVLAGRVSLFNDTS